MTIFPTGPKLSVTFNIEEWVINPYIYSKKRNAVSSVTAIGNVCHFLNNSTIGKNVPLQFITSDLLGDKIFSMAFKQLNYAYICYTMSCYGCQECKTINTFFFSEFWRVPRYESSRRGGNQRLFSAGLEARMKWRR